MFDLNPESKHPTSASLTIILNLTFEPNPPSATQMRTQTQLACTWPCACLLAYSKTYMVTAVHAVAMSVTSRLMRFLPERLRPARDVAEQLSINPNGRNSFIHRMWLIEGAALKSFVVIRKECTVYPTHQK